MKIEWEERGIRLILLRPTAREQPESCPRRIRVSPAKNPSAARGQQSGSSRAVVKLPADGNQIAAE